MLNDVFQLQLNNVVLVSIKIKGSNENARVMVSKSLISKWGPPFATAGRLMCGLLTTSAITLPFLFFFLPFE